MGVLEAEKSIRRGVIGMDKVSGQLSFMNNMGEGEWGEL